MDCLVRTGRADFPHPALGQDLTPSPTTRRAQAGSDVRARSARRDARVDFCDTVAEGARRATGETVSQEAARRDPEVVAIARRRKFSGSEKRRLLAEAGRCKEAGTLGAFLRRERIYSSMIASWRKQVGVADRAALAPKRRGPKPDASARQIQQLERDNARLRHKLGRAELIIDAQKKLVPRRSKWNRLTVESGDGALHADEIAAWRAVGWSLRM